MPTFAPVHAHAAAAARRPVRPFASLAVSCWPVRPFASLAVPCWPAPLPVPHVTPGRRQRPHAVLCDLDLSPAAPVERSCALACRCFRRSSERLKSRPVDCPREYRRAPACSSHTASRGPNFAPGAASIWMRMPFCTQVRWGETRREGKLPGRWIASFFSWTPWLVFCVQSALFVQESPEFRRCSHGGAQLGEQGARQPASPVHPHWQTFWESTLRTGPRVPIILAHDSNGRRGGAWQTTWAALGAAPERA